MNENVLKPQIRFKGFTDAWEQCKLGNIAAKVTEKNTQNSIKETFTNSAEMGVVSQRDFFDHDIAKADKIDGYYIVQENDFIYNPRISVTAPCGPINRNKLGRKGVMSPLYTIFRTNGINPLFLEWYFKSSCWYAYMYFNGDSGARSDRFSIKNELFFDMPIPLPKDDEQWRIGLLLESLNNLITLHQRKYERLQSLKKGLLEKMFPTENENVPKIRFKGFTDAWEQRKLNEITDVRDGTHNSPKYVQEGHPFITSKNVNNGFINYDDVQYVTNEDYEEINKRSKVDIHDILMGMIGTIGNLALITEKPDFAIKNVALIKYTGNVDCFYLYQTLQTDCILSQLSIGMDGGTQKFVSLKKIRELEIPIPKKYEQVKIGELFKNLDNLITLHQRECEKLQNLKKALLEKMFC